MNAAQSSKSNIIQIGHFIDGKHVAGESGRFGDVCNPTLGAVTGKVALGSKRETERAIAKIGRAHV